MAEIEPFDSDKFLTRTLFNNFGRLLVFVFYSEAEARSVELKGNLEATISIFGDHQHVKYYFIGREAAPETFTKFEVQHTPTVLFTQTDKKVLRRLTTEDVGSIYDALGQEIVEFRARFEKERAVWHPKIKSILEESQVILFIKGTADAPKCGFTETLLALFQQHGISFAYYDILADEYMRYWLRNYSGWPTYPQVYSNAQLIGGLDVCKDLAAKGQLLARVPRNCGVVSSERLKELLAEYKHLAVINNFSYADQATHAFLSQIKAQHPDHQLKVYNVSLDSELKVALNEAYHKEFPLFFSEGILQTI